MTLPIVAAGAAASVEHYLKNNDLVELLTDIGRDNPVVVHFIAGWCKSAGLRPQTPEFNRVAGLAASVYKLLCVQDEANQLTENENGTSVRSAA